LFRVFLVFFNQIFRNHIFNSFSLSTSHNVNLSNKVGHGSVKIIPFFRNKKEEAVAAERKKLIGKARIGGGFDLIDQNGKPTKSDQFLGQGKTPDRLLSENLDVKIYFISCAWRRSGGFIAGPLFQISFFYLEVIRAAL